MRALHVLAAFPRHDNDPIVPWLVRLMDEMRASGIESDVYTSAYKGGGNSEFHGHRIHRFRYAPASMETFTHDERAVDKARKSGPLSKVMPQIYLAGGIAGTAKLRQKLPANHYDIIHVHWPFPHWIFAEALKGLFSAATVSSFYEAEFGLAGRTPGGEAVLRRAIRKSDEIAAISSWTAGRIRKIEPRDAHIIPYSMGTVPEAMGEDEISALIGQKEARREASEARTILFVGNLIERKGVDVLIRAMHALPESFRLVVAGEGGMKDEWMAQAEPLGQRVRFAGRVSNEEIGRLYAESDFFVLSAKTDKAGEVEGQGVVLLEAMAKGLPCVASRSGGIVDLVRDGETGLLAKENDPASVAKAIMALDADKALRDRCIRGGAALVRNEFSWPHLAQRWAGVYEAATQHRKKR